MPRPMRQRLAAVLVLPWLGFGAGAQPLVCGAPQKPQQVVELLFGRKVGGRIAVSEAQWLNFLDREITPRFPDGLTVYMPAASGAIPPATGSCASRARW